MGEAVHAGTVKYPKLPPLIDFSYTCSHGVSPGVISIRTQAGDTAPSGFGDMVVSDGFRGMVIQACKMERLTVARAGGGYDWCMEFSDCRWQWKNTSIDGWYNQYDPNSKLIPKTVRSPTELAALCLRAMGVRRFTIDMPPGLSAAQVAAIPEFLPTGVQFPAFGVNPSVNWLADNAANSLAQLCDQMGRRLVYDPVQHAVHVIQPGVGTKLFPGSVAMEQLSITPPETPNAVQVVGEPTKYEGMFELYPVGLEWDGTLRPIATLSYAPRLPQKRQSVKFTVGPVTDRGPFTADRYYINWKEPTRPDATDLSSGTVEPPLGTDPAVIAAQLKAGIDAALARAGRAAQWTVVQSGNVITMTYVTRGVVIDFVTSPGVTREITANAAEELRGWEYSAPPSFAGVVETDRLTLEQATALAVKSVWKMFRITGRDSYTLRAPIVIPGYGRVPKRQDIVLLSSRTKQVVPQKGDREFIDLNLDPLIRQVYDGYSRDMKPEVYGEVCLDILRGKGYVGGGLVDSIVGADIAVGLRTLGLGQNSPPGTLLPADFSIDSNFNSICFTEPIYKYGLNGLYVDPKLHLLTGCHIRNNRTNALETYRDTYRMTPGQYTQVIKRNDVQLGIIGEWELVPYGAGKFRWKPKAPQLLEADAVVRARAYLNAALNVLRVKPGQTRQYNGIVPTPMSGLVAQTTYTITGGQGCSTTVSLNCEHDMWIPPYPQRRRAENLDAVARDSPLKAKFRLDKKSDPES